MVNPEGKKSTSKRKILLAILLSFGLVLSVTFLLSSLFSPAGTVLSPGCTKVLTYQTTPFLVKNGRFAVVGFDNHAPNTGEMSDPAAKLAAMSPGLYPLNSSTPLWTFAPDTKAALFHHNPDSNVAGVYASPDGQSLVRLSENEPALAFYRAGRLIKSYSLDEVQRHPTITRNCSWAWIKSVEFQETTGELSIYHLNGKQLKFDIATGQLLSLTTPATLSDFLWWLLFGLIFLAVGGWFFLRQSKNSQPA